MLSRENRITRAADFRSTVRSGKRQATPHAVVYCVRRADEEPSRFGFIVSKSVGNSVARHFVTRRLRAIGHDILPGRSLGRDVVIRALPGSLEADWASLRDEIAQAVEAVAATRSEARG